MFPREQQFHPLHHHTGLVEMVLVPPLPLVLHGSVLRQTPEQIEFAPDLDTIRIFRKLFQTFIQNHIDWPESLDSSELHLDDTIFFRRGILSYLYLDVGKELPITREDGSSVEMDRRVMNQFQWKFKVEMHRIVLNAITHQIMPRLQIQTAQRQGRSLPMDDHIRSNPWTSNAQTLEQILGRRINTGFSLPHPVSSRMPPMWISPQQLQMERDHEQLKEQQHQNLEEPSDSELLQKFEIYQKVEALELPIQECSNSHLDWDPDEPPPARPAFLGPNPLIGPNPLMGAGDRDHIHDNVLRLLHSVDEIRDEEEFIDEYEAGYEAGYEDEDKEGFDDAEIIRTAEQLMDASSTRFEDVEERMDDA